MSQNARKLSPVRWLIYGIAGLSSLFLIVLVWIRATGGIQLLIPNTPQNIIKKILWEVGISEQTIKYWIAVSAFETAGWTSRVYKDSNNLFCIIVPGSKRLQYGEGQTIFATLDDSVYGLYKHVMLPFRYPAHVESSDALVDFMKSKGYFTSDVNAYKAGVRIWYAKLFL